MEPFTILALILIFATAIIFSPLGLGGGLIFMPILHYIMDWEIKTAILGSLILVWSVSLGSQFAHQKGGHGDIAMAKKGMLFGVPGAIIGVILGFLLIEHVSDITIKMIALVIVSWICYKAILRILSKEDITGEVIGEMNEKYWLTGIFMGGMSSGLLGIGGGGIFVTMNRNYGGLDSKSSAGTAFMLAVMIVPTAIISHSLIDGNASNLIEEATKIGIFVPLLVMCLSFSGAKYAIKYLPVKAITGLFILIISISMLKYIQEIIAMVI